MVHVVRVPLPVARLVAAIAAIVVVVAGCGIAPGAPLEGRTFLSTGVTVAGVERPLVDGTRLRLQLGVDGQLGANAGCNSIGGTYRIDGTVLVFEGGSMTEMGCDQPRHDQDDWFAGFLASRPSVAIAGDELVLTSGETAIRLLDRETAEPDATLPGRTWIVTTLYMTDVAVSVPGDAVAGLELLPDGRFNLMTGCNEGGGRYLVAGDQIAFAEIGLTKRACAGPTGDLERSILEVLRAERITWRVEASRLTLSAGPVGLDLTAR